MFARRLAASTSRLSSPSTIATRNYAISVKEHVPLEGKAYPRVYTGKKNFQYNWYTRILSSTHNGSPLIILHHEDFSANRLKKLRSDIAAAARKYYDIQAKRASLDSPKPITEADIPTLTVIRTSIFGAALRAHAGVNLQDFEAMINNTPGNYAVLQFPPLEPPLLSAILRAMERSAPPRPPKTPEQIAKEEAAKKADPDQPGRRMKRSRPELVPDMKVMGALIEGKVFLPQGVKGVAELPTLDTLRAQIVGLLSAPGAQIAGVLSQAAGGQLARTLEGLKKALEEEQNGSSSPPP
ncbi:hypothetical protein VNI00_002306 [Paramarasmius palmivorus]|uniref:Uncharacterized protein n=1 Tax=Paramarasmius palmivorus TaxID=297713 RepID=A0AAW0E4A2_9AGAR